MQTQANPPLHEIVHIHRLLQFAVAIQRLNEVLEAFLKSKWLPSLAKARSKNAAKSFPFLSTEL